MSLGEWVMCTMSHTVWLIRNDSFKMSHRTYQHRSYFNISLIFPSLTSLKNGWMVALQSCGSNLGHVIVGLATESMLFGLIWVKFLSYSSIHQRRNMLWPKIVIGRVFRRLDCKFDTHKQSIEPIIETCLSDGLRFFRLLIGCSISPLVVSVCQTDTSSKNVFKFLFWYRLQNWTLIFFILFLFQNLFQF